MVTADRQIDDALGDMVSLGVRALLVRRDQRIVGPVTSYDIQGERPIQFLQFSNYRHHHDIRVADTMIPWDALRAIHLEHHSIHAGRRPPALVGGGQFDACHRGRGASRSALRGSRPGCHEPGWFASSRTSSPKNLVGPSRPAT
jgi:hypothetical protein